MSQNQKPKQGQTAVGRDELTRHLDGLLESSRFKDYGPNGLQVEGRREVRHVVSGVTASLAFIEAAIEAGADALLVHHGLFWRGHDGRVTGWMRQRLGRLLAADVSLLAYHLPLDAHPELGNNAQWGRQMGWVADARFGEQDLGFVGALAPHTTLEDLVASVSAQSGRACTAVAGDGRSLRRVAWCSGGAQGYFEPAIAAGADVFLTGEISEPQAHLARETGVAFVACGHHASERHGVQAVGTHLAATLGVTHRFIDIDNPA